MKFKSELKVKCINNGGRYDLTIGKIYTIKRPHPFNDMFYITNDSNKECQFKRERFIQYKKELLTETDYLDAFQQNFKES